MQRFLLTLLPLLAGACLLAQPAEFTARDGGDGLVNFFLQGQFEFDGTPAGANDFIGAFDPNFIAAGFGPTVMDGNGTTYMQSVGVNDDDAATPATDEGITLAGGSYEKFYLIAYNAANQQYYIFPTADQNNSEALADQFDFASDPGDPAGLVMLDFMADDVYNFATTTPFIFPALPIVLLRFEAQLTGETVTLEWTTATETNNDYFTLERSADGERYAAIGTVAGAGTTESPTKYAYVDADPLYGTSYYRIKQTDYDGTYTYTPVRSVTRTRGDIAISPNPVAGEATVQLPELGREEAVTLTVFNALGQPVLSRTVSTAGGTQTLDLATLPAGSYHVDVRARSFHTTQTLIKG